MGSKPSKISASRGASILGLNYWQSQFEIWQIIREELEPGFNDHHGYTLPPPSDNASIRWGTAFEDAVVSLAALSRNQQIYDREKFYENGIMTCHIDGIYTDDTLHEGKTTSIMAYRAKWGEPGTDHVPTNYQIQAQHQMYCTEAQENIISVLVFPKTPDEWESMGWIIGRNADDGYFIWREVDNKIEKVNLYDLSVALNYMGFFHQYPIPRNETMINTILEAYQDFWNTFILGDNEPEIDRYADVIRVFPEPIGTIVCSEQQEQLLAEYSATRDELSKSGPLAKRQEQIKTMLLDNARKAEPIIDDESREKTIFMSRDGKKLASYYRTKTGSYVFR